MLSLLGQLSGEHQIDAARRVLDLSGFDDLKNVGELLPGDKTLLEVKTSSCRLALRADYLSRPLMMVALPKTLS